MMIKWLDEAVKDLQALHQYIAQDKRIAANRITTRILTAVNLLSDQPHIGRIGRISGTRELIISGTPYFIPYRVHKNVIEILRVYHFGMQWPSSTKN